MKRLLLFAYTFMGLMVFGQKTHTVEPKENPYSISKKYGLTAEELYRLNPQIKDGKLNIGDVLVVSPKKTDTAQPLAKGNTATIVLQPKQTIYGITKQYRISEAELRRLNPDLDSHMKIGEEVILPSENVKKYADANAFNRNVSYVPPTETQPTESIPSAETPKATENGSYTVQPKDTYYGISKTFGISQKELLDLNPGLEQKGLQPGEKIWVKKNNSSVKDTVTWQEDTSKKNPPAEEYQTYTVQDGDTVFGILNKFSITFGELLALNPKLAEGLNTGMVLRVKKLEEGYEKKSGDALSVILMLPFGFDDKEVKYRSLASDFLTGAQLALERRTASGQKLDVKIVDSGSESSFKNSLSQINKSNTDLIIGPFFKSNVKEALEYVKSQKIPLVAPFANAPELLGYNNLVMVETNQNVFAERIVKEVSAAYSDQKIYIVSGSDTSHATLIKNALIAQLKNPTISIVSSAEEIQLDQNMMTGQTAPVMAVLASDNDDLGAAFTKKIAAIAEETAGVKTFSMFYHPSFEKDLEGLSKASLVYLMDRKINEEGTFEKEILAAYKTKYCKAPSKYAVIGFDVVHDILSRENSKAQLFKQMDKIQTQLATKFEYVKTKDGAYINQGYRVVRLVP